MTTFTATQDAGQITMAGTLWSDTFAVADADRRLAFYERMNRDYPGQKYGQAADALRAAMGETDERTSDTSSNARSSLSHWQG